VEKTQLSFLTEDKKGKMFTNNTIQKKVNRTYTIEKQLADRFKQTSDKDARKMSNVVESYIRRYVESKS
jgi:hypothetical protein